MIYDVCVIGGGPAGMFSAYYSSSRGLQTVLIEADSKLGGRMHYYLDMAIYDLPGNFGITGKAYLNNLLEQLEKSPTKILLTHLVQSIIEHPDYLEILTPSTVLKARTIIVATGNGYLETKKLSDCRLSKDCLNFLSYDIPKFQEFANNAIAIIGHTPTAIDWALQAKNTGNNVYLYAYKPLTLQPILMDALDTSNISISQWSDVKSIQLTEKKLVIDDVHFDRVYVQIGTAKTLINYPSPLKQIDNGLTELNRIFIAGDARYENGKVKLLLGAMHDAMQAVNHATQVIHPDEYFQPIVSTHHPIFKEWES